VGKRKMKGPRLKWKFNVKIDLKEIRCEVVELAQGRDNWQFLLLS
jgi:hypothetical protein